MLLCSTNHLLFPSQMAIVLPSILPFPPTELAHPSLEIFLRASWAVSLYQTSSCHFIPPVVPQSYASTETCVCHSDGGRRIFMFCVCMCMCVLACACGQRSTSCVKSSATLILNSSLRLGWLAREPLASTGFLSARILSVCNHTQHFNTGVETNLGSSCLHDMPCNYTIISALWCGGFNSGGLKYSC